MGKVDVIREIVRQIVEKPRTFVNLLYNSHIIVYSSAKALSKESCEKIGGPLRGAFDRHGTGLGNEVLGNSDILARLLAIPRQLHSAKR